jgi:glycosyltransferase involved in cell wall biosynthesis
MRVAIYNRWLQTMGGGEKYCGALAQCLADTHDVQFVTHEPADLAEVGNRLGLDLTNTSLRYVPDRADFRSIADASAEYDLFVNASHLDYFAPRARRNWLVVYFPSPSIGQARALGGYNRAKRVLLGAVARALGKTARNQLRRLAFANLNASSDQTIVGHLALGAFRLAAGGPHQRDVLDAYERIVTISAFSQGWIERYWQRPSAVLYPPVDVASFPVGDKRKSILGVGRFFAGGHNKKHLELIEAFGRTRTVLADWELHLAGGFASTVTSAAYLAEVKRRAGGDRRIHLHVNCGYDVLRDLYAQSRFFWHATGLGENETEHPERFEHFGLTTVEAMAAGCVPIVLRAGGQTEIIRPGLDGVLWSSLDELVFETISLAGDCTRTERLSRAAREGAQRFGMMAFRERLDELVDGRPGSTS